MATAADLKAEVTNLKKEVTETKQFVTEQNVKIDAGLARIEELLAQDASDAELRAVVDEVVPEIRAASDELDELQPKPEDPPV